jgi:hypothetical protein
VSAVELVEVVARALVDDPDSVEVTEVDGEHNLLIELKVSPEDIGKVIGKDGKTAQAIRTLLSAVPHNGGRRVHLDILD